ncbi:unnamed protein product [Psylliodes chrysocephalus]|uniref:Phorbol-ester/DAG-type domain-containing protein n=1 Tax=Psylliodes chrysocephalus TaxID=3402493 RepID=A0A9P0GCX2_9CUCU|nr:unnamed protein product [Psylliodes chrysocephala]
MSENGNAPSVTCVRCKKTVTTGIKCIKCGTLSHNSCLKSLKTVTFLSDGSVICCSDPDNSNNLSEVPKVQSKVQEIIESRDNSVDKITIKYLEELMKQKDITIKNQEVAITALNEQIILLKKFNAMSSSDSKNTCQPLSIGNAEVWNTTQRRDRAPTKNNSSENSDGNSKLTSAAIQTAVYNAEATSLCNDIINLNQRTSTTNSFNRNNTIKRTKPRNLLVGTSDDHTLKAATYEVMTFFHSTNWNPDTTIDEVKSHLKKIDSKIEVKQLNSRFPAKYASFKVSVPKVSASTFLRPEVWPKGVYLNEFFRSEGRTTEPRDYPTEEKNN